MVLQAEYRYNGLGMKLGWHYDADNDNDVDGSVPWYYFCFDEKWQAITRFRGSDSDAKERFIYHTAGLDGTGSVRQVAHIAKELLLGKVPRGGRTEPEA